ncbi:hypothetical protein FA13DRAFT_1797748 [Coprinellus micaceus]|uniref:F-box domain-containing protein n=1 Tax=Coprinellus micaceus TaxID=71717 RepID=A0A4Y7SRK0_COPMI|nr:hypothetical protein FA13DRAFT_1797748 [Coprinellus micaceus]
MTGARAQQSLRRSTWVNIVELWLSLCILAKLVGLILLILTSIVLLPVLALLLALGLLCLSILSVIPFLFVMHAVPWLNDFFRHLAERDVNEGSLAQLPPEILQKIFDHCCDQEYVDFFHHFSLGPTEERRCNTVYTLKSVCKEWKFLAETTPTLWQKIQFGSFYPPRVQEPDHKGEDVFRSLRHCTDMMEQVLLPRSGQLPIQIGVTRRCGPFHMHYPGSLCNHVGYTLPLLKLISPQSHRFTSLALDGWGCEEGEVVENLIYILSSIDFRHLEVLALDGGVPWGRYPSSQPPFNLFQHAPKLAKLVLSGSEPWMRGRGGITENLIIRWSKITTLELNLSRYDRNGPTVSVSEVARVLQAVCHNLIHLSWMGDWHCHGNYFEERRVAAAISKLPEIFGGPQLVLSDLHSLTLADKDNEFQFSTIFLPKIMCPKLEELRVLLCTEDQSYGYNLREKSVARPP